MAAHQPVILDCTIRDGSYAIDFKFTAADTAMIAGELDRAGLTYIEVGHGLGLGASEAGKGTAASHDLEVIERTREATPRARIGAFFIPGIGDEQKLRDAAAAGLDFIRIGQNANEIEQAWPFVELARELGVEPFVNFMKTYGIAPEQFAASSATAAGLGAAGVYVVDSAGGMLPQEVQEYVTRTLEACDTRVGFHGHSNLHLAVANSIAAYDAGATFVDTSVYGIGRSSGNVPTEVMAAVFERLGVDCGVDPLGVIDLAESYLRPLAEHLHPHDMTAVSLGYGRFHSSFLPRAMRAAEAAGINPFRLIVALGTQDPMELSDEMLSETVERLRDERPPEIRREVASFSDPRFGPRRIGNRPQAVGELIDGLEVVAAKRHLQIVFDVVVTDALEEEWVTAEFVMEDEGMALGRLRAGSAAAAAEALGPHAARVDLALLDVDRLDPAASSDAVARLRRELGRAPAIYRSGQLELDYLGDVALTIAAAEDRSEIVLADAGRYRRADVDALAARLSAFASVERAGGSPPPRPGALVVVAGPPPAEPEAGALVAIAAAAQSDGGTRVLDRADAYRGTLPRWLRASDAAGSAAPVGS